MWRQTGGLVDGDEFVRFNPVPIFKGVIRPGGRVVSADTGSFGGDAAV